MNPTCLNSGYAIETAYLHWSVFICICSIVKLHIMKPKTKTLLSFLHILSWIAFVGLAIKAGSFLISYIVSIKNPVASKDLYNDTGLSAYRQLNFWNYSVFVWYKILLYATQPTLLYY